MSLKPEAQRTLTVALFGAANKPRYVVTDGQNNPQASRSAVGVIDVEAQEVVPIQPIAAHRCQATYAGREDSAQARAFLPMM
jgi:hypothetical protein